MRCHTSKSGEEQISFQEHVDRTREGQNDIYYINGESIAAPPTPKPGPGRARGVPGLQQSRPAKLVKQTKMHKQL